MDCKQINELMLEYLYQELDTSQMERVQAHLQSCAGCAEELAAYEKTRSMMQGLQEQEPSPSITDLLMKEAVKAAEPRSAGFWDRLRESMRMMVLHPAMTAAVTLVLVLGVSFYVYRESAPPTAPMEPETLGVAIDQPMGEAATITLPQDQQYKEQQAGQLAGGKMAQQYDEPDQNQDKKIAAVRAAATTESSPLKIASGRNRAGGMVSNEKKIGFALDKAEDSSVGQRSKDVLKQLSGRAAETRSTARRDNRPAPPAMAPSPIKSKGAPSNSLGIQGTGSLSKNSKSMAHNKAPMPRPTVTKRKALADPFTDDVRYRGKKRARRQRATAADLEELDQTAAPMKQPKGKTAAKPRPSMVKSRPKSVLPTGKAPSSAAQDLLYAKAPARKLRKPATTQFKKRPAPKTGKQRMSRKGPSKDDKAYSYKLLALANEASAQSRCGAAFQYYSQALAMNPDLRRIISKRVQSCTGRLASKDEGSLTKAQKSYPRLASMMEPALRKVRRARKSKARAKAKVKADETQKKASKVKKAKQAH